MKTNKILIIAIVTLLFTNCIMKDKTLQNTLIMSHSLEAPKNVYDIFKKNININTYYKDKAILVSFELNDSKIVTQADESICQFNSFGKLILFKHIDGQFSKWLIGKNIRLFNIIDKYDAPGYDFVIDGNKLFEK
jgi:hypothetical protein